MAWPSGNKPQRYYYLVGLVLVPIRRDVMSVVQVEVGEHEIPVLQSVHGERCMADRVEGTPDSRTFLDAREEFERLGNLYGRTATGQLHVEQAYGSVFEFERSVRAISGARRRCAGG